MRVHTCPHMYMSLLVPTCPCVSILVYTCQAADFLIDIVSDPVSEGQLLHATEAAPVSDRELPSAAEASPIQATQISTISCDLAAPAPTTLCVLKRTPPQPRSNSMSAVLRDLAQAYGDTLARSTDKARRTLAFAATIHRRSTGVPPLQCRGLHTLTACRHRILLGLLPDPFLTQVCLPHGPRLEPRWAVPSPSFDYLASAVCREVSK